MSADVDMWISLREMNIWSFDYVVAPKADALPDCATPRTGTLLFHLAFNCIPFLRNIHSFSHRFTNLHVTSMGKSRERFCGYLARITSAVLLGRTSNPKLKFITNGFFCNAPKGGLIWHDLKTAGSRFLETSHLET